MPNVYNTGTPDDEINAQRDLIARMMAAQALGISLEQYDAAVGGGGVSAYEYPTDPSDPADYSAAPSVSNVGFTSNAPGHLADSATNPDGTLGSVLGNPSSGMPSPGYTSPSVSDLSTQAQPGEFGAAPAPAPGLPAGFFSTGYNNPGETVSANPTSTLGDQIGLNDITGGTPVAQGLQMGGLNLAGYNVAPAFNAFEGAQVTGTPSDFTAADQAMAALNDAVAAQFSDALAGYAVTGPATGPATGGTPGGFGTGTGFSSAQAANDAVGAALASAIDAASGGYTGGGPTGSGEGGSAGVGISGGGVGDGVGGASTGISGGPGGSGEGGANTGEGGGGGGGGGGAGK